jgi:transposase
VTVAGTVEGVAGQGTGGAGGSARYAGVDWSWSEHALCVVDEAGAAVERLTLPHSAVGLSRLVTVLHRHAVAGVAIERGDGPVVQALLAAGLVVFVVPSRQVTALRSRYGVAGNKDDRFDAYLLADVLRTDRRRLQPLTVDSPETLGLRMLIRVRHDLVVARVAAHNQLRAHLLTAFPGAVGLFHQLDGGISLKFLTRFGSPRQARWLSDKRLAAWLAAAKYSRRGTRSAEQLMGHLRQAPPGLLNGPAADAAEAVTAELVALLLSLRARIAALEAHIERAMTAHVDAPVFTSLPRSGMVRAATLLAEIGDARGRYPSEDALAAAAGVSPSTRASGTAATAGSGKRSSTSPTAAAAAAPGPNPSMTAHAPEAPGILTPSASWPGPGCGSSGAAGPITSPTTRAAMAASTGCSSPNWRGRLRPADQSRISLDQFCPSFR